MNTSTLNNFLEKNITQTEFIDSLNNEVADYIKKLKKTGISIDIYFHEDEDIYIDRPKMETLLKEMSNNKKNIPFLKYICDCLTLGEKVHYKDVDSTELIFDLADEPYTDDEFTKRISAYLNV